MPKTVDKLQPYLKKRDRKGFTKWYIFSALLLLILYTIFVSPLIEPVIEENFFSAIREVKAEKFNYLTPVYATSETDDIYSLSVVSPGTALDEIKSRTKYYVKDPRILAMSEFLADYNSPMQPYAETFIVVADEFGLDWRLVAAISGVESAFGNIHPQGTYNGWGWRGINKNEDGWSIFDSWEHSISHITERIALGYGTDITPFSMEATYCPPCGRNPAHLWANGVTRYMNELQYYVDNLERM
jgi:hypothetical protein